MDLFFSGYDVMGVPNLFFHVLNGVPNFSTTQDPENWKGTPGDAKEYISLSRRYAASSEVGYEFNAHPMMVSDIWLSRIQATRETQCLEATPHEHHAAALASCLKVWWLLATIFIYIYIFIVSQRFQNWEYMDTHGYSNTQTVHFHTKLGHTMP